MNWTIVYNGTNKRWVIDGLDYGEVYVFQVAALNRIGWSTFSGNSTMHTSVAVTKSRSSRFAVVMSLFVSSSFSRSILYFDTDYYIILYVHL